jgi:hypothetical protein
MFRIGCCAITPAASIWVRAGMSTGRGSLSAQVWQPPTALR